MSTFKIGDSVIVKDNQEIYTTYTDMFEKLGFKNIIQNNLIKNGQVATVFAIDVHPDHNETLLAIRDGFDNEVLISTEGVELAISHDLEISNKDRRIKELESALERCLDIWGRGYEPTQDIPQTIGSLLYVKCKKLLKK